MNSREWLCLWYLRLNGYFTMPNFIAHGRNGPLTEVDVLGIRFPHSREFLDDERLEIPTDSVDIVFAEAKEGRIDELNGPWSSPGKGALDYVLRRVGVVPTDQANGLAVELYHTRKAKRDGFQIRIVCFARDINQDLQVQGVTFVPWTQVLGFIHQRFSENQRLKEDHQVWDDFGRYLWDTLIRNVPDANAFFVDWDRRRRNT